MPPSDTTNTRREKSQEYDQCTIGLREQGLSFGGITTTLGIPKGTVSSIFHRWEKTGTTLPKKRSGRPCTISERGQRALVKSVRADPFKPYAAHQVTLEQVGINVHRNTIINSLGRLGFGSYSPARKPALTTAHMQKRLDWACERANWTVDQRRNVIWSDESRFTVWGNDGGAHVLRREGERYDLNHIVPTVKFGKGSVMIWSCFWAGGFGPLVILDGAMDQDAYVNCLSDNLLPFLRALSDDHPEREFIFQEDGASCHTGSYTTWYKTRWQIRGFDTWPAQSPDLNPIEHVWWALERRIQSRRRHIKNKEQLKVCLQNEWRNLSLKLAESLVASMPCRCQAVINAQGGHTHY